MNGDDIQKLIGGYATGTLNESERKALFEAALHDQMLFDALANEEVLRDLLQDQDSRAQVLRALEPRAKPSWWSAWIRRPATWAIAGSLAAATILVTVMAPPAVLRQPEQLSIAADSKAPEPQLSARAKPAE